MKKSIKKSRTQSNIQRSRSRLQSSQMSQCMQHKPLEPSSYVKQVLVEFDQFQQLYEGIDILPFINGQTHGLNVRKLLLHLEKRYNIFIKDKLVKFYLEEGNLYVTIPNGKRAFSLFQIQQEDYLGNEIIKIQLIKDKQLIEVVMEDSSQQSDQNLQDDQQADQDDKNLQVGKCRRLKERKIKHVIDKVLKWRQLYAGTQNGNEGAVQRVPLEEGAKIVKISKKTLDDYLSQLKKGRKYGFNFNDHKNEKIGVLREFIRKMERKK